MFFYTREQATRWIDERDRAAVRDRPHAPGGDPFEPGRAHDSDVVSISTASLLRRSLGLARAIVDSMPPFHECLLFIEQVHDPEIFHFPNENLHLFYRLRESYGERRPVDEIPGHLFLAHERADLLSYLQLVLIFGWEAGLSTRPGGPWGSIEDGIVTLRADDVEGVTKLHVALGEVSSIPVAGDPLPVGNPEHHATPESLLDDADQHSLDRAVEAVASLHGFSAEVGEVVHQALLVTGGSLAQFNHPDLGGPGQWMPGMTQIGAMFDERLKARVASLCEDLSDLVRLEPARQKPAVTTNAGACPFTGGTGGDWPAGLGPPTAAGAQNDVRYAYFAGPRRLAVRRGGVTTVYETADHDIRGVAQQQGGGREDVTFTSQKGVVGLRELRAVEGTEKSQ